MAADVELQAVSDPNILLMQSQENAFAETLRLSYMHHIPLQLSPD